MSKILLRQDVMWKQMQVTQKQMLGEQKSVSFVFILQEAAVNRGWNVATFI